MQHDSKLLLLLLLLVEACYRLRCVHDRLPSLKKAGVKSILFHCELLTTMALSFPVQSLLNSRVTLVLGVGFLEYFKRQILLYYFRFYIIKQLVKVTGPVIILITVTDFSLLNGADAMFEPQIHRPYFNSLGISRYLDLQMTNLYFQRNVKSQFGLCFISKNRLLMQIFMF